MLLLLNLLQQGSKQSYIIPLCVCIFKKPFGQKIKYRRENIFFKKNFFPIVEPQSKLRLR